MSTGRIAYLVSRFPVVTETFILREMDELERRGATIDLFSLLRDRPDVLHPAAEARLGDLVTGSDLGLRAVIGAQLHWLRVRPGRLLRCWTEAVAGNRRSLRFLMRALVVVPVAAAFARTMEARSVDRIHAHWATHPALAAYVIHQLTGLPYGVTAHAHDIHVDVSMLAEKLSAADAVVTISEANRQHLVETIPTLADRVSVIRCGVPEATVVTSPPDVWAEGPIDLVCVASLKPYKGHRHLLAACRLLAERGHDVRCALAGAGPECDALMALVGRLDLGGRVRFLGALDAGAVQRQLSAADIFVLPSIVEPSGKTEGIPVALMEAMAAGVPVVASRLSGIPELIDDGASGLLVEPGDERALADAIESLIVDPTRAATLAAAAADKVAAEFTVEHNGARLAELLAIGPRQAEPVRS